MTYLSFFDKEDDEPKPSPRRFGLRRGVFNDRPFVERSPKPRINKPLRLKSRRAPVTQSVSSLRSLSRRLRSRGKKLVFRTKITLLSPTIIPRRLLTLPKEKPFRLTVKQKKQAKARKRIGKAEKPRHEAGDGNYESPNKREIKAIALVGSVIALGGGKYSVVGSKAIYTVFTQPIDPCQKAEPRSCSCADNRQESPQDSWVGSAAGPFFCKHMRAVRSWLKKYVVANCPPAGGINWNGSIPPSGLPNPDWSGFLPSSFPYCASGQRANITLKFHYDFSLSFEHQAGAYSLDSAGLLSAGYTIFQNESHAWGSSFWSVRKIGWGASFNTVYTFETDFFVLNGYLNLWLILEQLYSQTYNGIYLLGGVPESYPSPWVITSVVVT
jgi:hypothetical protein